MTHGWKRHADDRIVVKLGINFSRLREKTVRRASGEPDEGPATGHDLLRLDSRPCPSTGAFRAVFSRGREKIIENRHVYLALISYACLQNA